jgi:hypothetical protein
MKLNKYTLERPVPEHTIEMLERYVNDRSEPGSFGMAILTNNLSAAFRCADHFNLEHMKEIVHCLIWNLPAICWGSEEKVINWLEGGNDSE